MVNSFIKFLFNSRGRCALLPLRYSNPRLTARYTVRSRTRSPKFLIFPVLLLRKIITQKKLETSYIGDVMPKSLAPTSASLRCTLAPFRHNVFGILPSYASPLASLATSHNSEYAKLPFEIPARSGSLRQHRLFRKH